MCTIYKEIKFDDVVEYDKEEAKEYNSSGWASICDECYQKYKKVIPNKIISKGDGSGICGVEGCSNTDNENSGEEYNVVEKMHYINFPLNR